MNWGPYGRRPIVVLAGVGLVDAVDRGILAGVLTSVQDDLGFSDFQLGMLDTAYVFAGLLIALPAGYLADRHRRTRLIAAVLASWAAISAATAAAQNFAQFFTARAALGVGETIDDPASQSLICDYYPAGIRSRVFSYHRVTPTLGRALGIGLGAAVGAALGWRWAFLLVGVPGSLLALAVLRLPEPRRGAADLPEEEVAVAAVQAPDLAEPGVTAAQGAHDPVAGANADGGQDPSHAGSPRATVPPPPAASGIGEDPGDETASADERRFIDDCRLAWQVRSLRALVIGTAISSGALTGIAFWGAAFHQRHSEMSQTQAGSATGLLILLGAITGTLIGGRVGDRLRHSAPRAPMVGAGVSTAIGAVLIFLSVRDIPVWTARIPLQILAVGFLVAALPSLSAMIGEVTPAVIRGTAFSLLRVASTVIGAFSPPLLGWIALQRQVVGTGGEPVGDLGYAFGVFLPLLLIAASVLIRGGRWVEADLTAANADTAARQATS